MQQDLWLEVTSCKDPSAAKELCNEEFLRIPSLNEAMRVAEKTNAEVRMKGRQMWDYSRKLVAGEVADMMVLFARSKKKDDVWSVSHSMNVIYNCSCYTLTLFAFKSQ